MSESVTDFIASFRNFVLAGTTVSGLVGTRVFSDHLATLFNPVFPLGTFEILAGNPSAAGITEDFEMNVAGHSEKSYDEAGNIFTAIHDTVKNQIIPPRITVYSSRTPVKLYDSNSRVYTVVGRVRVVRIP